VRYDSPVFAGFSVSASWGEDDFWDMAVRYSGVWGDFKFASTAAYSESTDANMGLSDLFPAPVDKDSSYFQIGAYLEHTPTGLFAYGAYGTEDNHDNITPGAGARIPSNDQFYLKAGAKENLLPLGQTVFYGEYAHNNNQLAPALLDSGFTKSELDRWGVGAVQYLDAAAMSVWVKYRHFDGSISDETTKIHADGFDLVVFGSAINF
jgi:predicted porin